MDSIKYHIDALIKELDAERAKSAATIAKLKDSVKLGVIRTDFKKLTHAYSSLSVEESRWSREKTALSFNGKNFAFSSEDFLKDLAAYIDATLNTDAEAIAHNKAINDHNHSVTQQLSVLASGCGFKNEYRFKVASRGYKQKYDSKFLNVAGYLSDFFERAPTYDIAVKKKELIDLATRYLADYKAAKAKSEEEKRVKALADPLLGEAIAYLTSKGKKVGTDFTAETAVSEANDLAYELEVERLKKDGGPFSFGGDDYCENCEGWNGSDPRCECGCRRVGWTKGYGHSFKNPSAEPEVN